MYKILQNPIYLYEENLYIKNIYRLRNLDRINTLSLKIDYIDEIIFPKSNS